MGFSKFLIWYTSSIIQKYNSNVLQLRLMHLHEEHDISLGQREIYYMDWNRSMTSENNIRCYDDVQWRRWCPIN